MSGYSSTTSSRWTSAGCTPSDAQHHARSGGGRRPRARGGQIYEIALFHAERHTGAVELQPHPERLRQPQEQCTSDCGDGKVAGNEECDDGDNAGGYGGCTSDCKLGPRCGDQMVQKDEDETCDDGNLVDTDGCSTLCELKGPG